MPTRLLTRTTLKEPISAICEVSSEVLLDINRLFASVHPYLPDVGTSRFLAEITSTLAKKQHAWLSAHCGIRGSEKPDRLAASAQGDGAYPTPSVAAFSDTRLLVSRAIRVYPDIENSPVPPRLPKNLQSAPPSPCAGKSRLLCFQGTPHSGCRGLRGQTPSPKEKESYSQCRGAAGICFGSPKTRLEAAILCRLKCRQLLNKSHFQRSVSEATTKHWRLFFLLQLDRSPVHQVGTVKRILEQRAINVLPWPPGGVDLNIIENVWGILKKRLSRRNLVDSSMGTLESAIREEWDRLWHFRDTLVRNLYESLPRRMQVVIETNGAYTRH
ncbi:hypothetical protein ISCGN_016148 [Ixodes scapularis]